jgi:hypothetical protein
MMMDTLLYLGLAALTMLRQQRIQDQLRRVQVAAIAATAMTFRFCCLFNDLAQMAGTVQAIVG